MSAKVEITEVVVKFKCCGRVRTQKMPIEDFRFAIQSEDSPCEVCGSHGSIGIDITCPKCKKCHYVQLREW